MVGKAKQKTGGVKWVSTPMSGRMMTSVCLPDAEYSQPQEKGLLLPIEGWLHTLHPKGRKIKISQETRIDSHRTRISHQMKKGGQLDNPQGVT